MQSKYNLETKTWNGPSIPYPFKKDFMVGNWIYESIKKEPAKVLQISEYDDCKMTCEDLRVNSIRIAQSLVKIGIVEDDVVCIFLKQSHLATYIVNACVFIGAILSPLDIELDSNDIQHVLSYIKPKIIICENEDILKIQEIITKIQLQIPIYSTSEGSISHSFLLNFMEPTFKEDQFVMPKFSKSSDEKILAILCSSGTTGRMKGVCITHMSCLSWFPLMSDTRRIISLCYSRLYWGSGFYRCLTTGIALNNLLIITNREFTVKNFIEICEKYNVTSTTMPPCHLAKLLHSDEFLSKDINSLNTFAIVGSILSKTLRNKFEENVPSKNLLVAYIMTEASIAMSLSVEYKKGLSVGSMIFPNTSVKIIDEDGYSLNKQQKGEICVKNGIKFMGYYNNPKATKDAVDNEGYLKTGDIGYFDEDGVLYVVDRKKDILKYKGFHINPSEIEDVIQSIEGVQHVSVVGIPDDLYYNLPAAAIVKLDGFGDLSEKDIIDYVESKLPEQKRLYGGVYFFDQLPMTLSGKIQKRFVLDIIKNLKSKSGGNISI